MATNNKKVYTQKTSPKGTLAWAFLAKPAKKYQQEDKEFKTDLILNTSEPGVKEFLEYIDAQVEAAYVEAQEDLKSKKKFADAKQVEKQLPYKPQYDDSGEETGNVVFKIKVDELSKDGKKRTIGLFDAKAKPINDPELSIGAGTTGKVNFASTSYYNPASKKAGIKLYLNAVQIIDLVPYGSSGNASSFGFGEEDGFEYENTTPPFMSENTKEGSNNVSEEDEEF